MKPLLLAVLAFAMVAAAPLPKPSIVLVHGAFADASSWAKVIPILERDGYEVTAVQIPLTSLPDDVATVRRFLDAQKRPVVLVGHSYGGVVITGAGAGSSNVKSLVYVAAFAPDANEPITATASKFPSPPANDSFVPDAAGFLTIDRAKFHDVFCNDLTTPEARLLAATQKPVNSSVFGATVPAAAWRTIPSWYIVSKEDRAIHPDLERFYAKRANAKTTEILSSHVPFLSHPSEVVKVIEAAAQ
ncbi:MAG TPA: alpha/beta hydrolase [Thermoanaerobaculia bacterium]